MCNSLLAIVGYLFLSVGSLGNPDDPVCRHVLHMDYETNGEFDCALLFLQKSAGVLRQSRGVQRQSRGDSERSRGRDALNETSVRRQDQQFVTSLRHLPQDDDEQRVVPEDRESSTHESKMKARETEVVNDLQDGHMSTLNMHKEFIDVAQRLGADDHDIVARMNARFGNGQPSNKFTEAGVVVHAFDGQFLSGAADDLQSWSASNSFWSASIINARVPYMFLGDTIKSLHAGFVISPEAATASLLCSYDGDGASMSLNPCYATDCIAGCIGVRDSAPTAPQTVRQWCKTNSTVQTRVGQAAIGLPADDLCAWQPNTLDMMMRQQEVQANDSDWLVLCKDGPCLYDNPYNEIVLDPNKIQENVQNAIEAIYFVTGPIVALSHEHATTGEKEAKKAQRLLLKMHGLRVPIVRFEPFRTQMPFEFMSEASQ